MEKSLLLQKNNLNCLRIGIDLMGGDHSPAILFQAAQQAIIEFPHVNFVVFLTQAVLDEILLSYSAPHVEFQIVSEIIEMQDDPLVAIRHKKNSSLVIGVKLLKKRYLDGFVSVGNTGALIAALTLNVALLPGIKRPALLANLPTKKENVTIIDVGGHLFCKAHHLVQFAQLGIAYQNCCHGIEKPRVGLLNIGVESKKGTSELRLAYQLLTEMAKTRSMQFIGNIEGREVFQGEVDVLVADGFTGNILLKTSEGVSSFILQKIDQSLKIFFSDPAILEGFYKQFDDEEYSGALVCGLLDAVAIKCHGQSSPRGLFKGIQRAIELIGSMDHMKNCFLRVAFASSKEPG